MIILNKCLFKKIKDKNLTLIYQHPQHKHLITSYHYEYWLGKKYVWSFCEIISLLSTHSTSTSVTSKSNKAMNKFYVLMLCVLFPLILSIQPWFQKIWLNRLTKLWTNENVKTGYMCIWRSWVYSMAFCGHSFLIYKVRAWDRSDPQLPTLANFLILHVLLARSKSCGYIPICLPVCVHCADMVTTSLGV